MDAVSFMRADRLARGGTTDLGPLLGRWVNVNPATDHLVRLDVEAAGAGLRLRAYGSGDPEPVDWGETTAAPYAAGSAAAAGGFLARYALGAVETWLVANQKLGILVIQSYTSFHDGSGRRAYFAREFFRRS
jgi:hypothetical protein